MEAELSRENQLEARGSLLDMKLRRFNIVLGEVVSDYGLISFHTLNIMQEHSVTEVIGLIDKATCFN